MTTREIFQKNLNYYIERSNKNKKTISDEMGIPYTTLVDWANGNKFPRADGIERVANYFKILKSDLLEERNKKETLFPDENITILQGKTRMVPLFESVSAGFGCLANDRIIDYIPLIINSDDEATDTICIKVAKVNYVYGEDWLELISLNPEYMLRRFEGQDVERVKTLGLVKQVIKNI